MNSCPLTPRFRLPVSNIEQNKVAKLSLLQGWALEGVSDGTSVLKTLGKGGSGVSLLQVETQVTSYQIPNGKGTKIYRHDRLKTIDQFDKCPPLNSKVEVSTQIHHGEERLMVRWWFLIHGQWSALCLEFGNDHEGIKCTGTELFRSIENPGSKLHVKVELMAEQNHKPYGNMSIKINININEFNQNISLARNDANFNNRVNYCLWEHTIEVGSECAQAPDECSGLSNEVGSKCAQAPDECPRLSERRTIKVEVTESMLRQLPKPNDRESMSAIMKYRNDMRPINQSCDGELFGTHKQKRGGGSNSSKDDHPSNQSSHKYTTTDPRFSILNEVADHDLPPVQSARSSTETIMNTKQTTPVRQRQQVAIATEALHKPVRKTLVLDIPGYYQ